MHELFLWMFVYILGSLGVSKPLLKSI